MISVPRMNAEGSPPPQGFKSFLKSRPTEFWKCGEMKNKENFRSEEVNFYDCEW